MKLIITIILVLYLLVIYRVLNDETYLFDKDKLKYIFWIVIIPIIGAIVAMRKIGYGGFFMKHMGQSKMLYPDVIPDDPHETDEDRIRRETIAKLI